MLAAHCRAEHSYRGGAVIGHQGRLADQPDRPLGDKGKSLSRRTFVCAGLIFVSRRAPVMPLG
jgi:hypothetical protein